MVVIVAARATAGIETAAVAARAVGKTTTPAAAPATAKAAIHWVAAEAAIPSVKRSIVNDRSVPSEVVIAGCVAARRIDHASVITGGQEDDYCQGEQKGAESAVHGGFDAGSA